MVTVPNEILYMYICSSLRIIVIMSNKSRFKNISNFLLKIILRNALDDRKSFLHKFKVFCGPNKKSLSFKLAETWPIL